MKAIFSRALFASFFGLQILLALLTSTCRADVTADVQSILQVMGKSSEELIQDIEVKLKGIDPENFKKIVAALEQASLQTEDYRFQHMSQQERVGHIIVCVPGSIGFSDMGVAGVCLDRSGLHLLSGFHKIPTMNLDGALMVGYYRGYGTDTKGHYSLSQIGLGLGLGIKGWSLTDKSNDSTILMVGLLVGVMWSLPLTHPNNENDLRID